MELPGRQPPRQCLLLLAALCAVWVVACNEAGGAVSLRGAAEKGPFVLGSSVSLSGVNARGKPTGLVFKTETTSDLGDFELDLNYYTGPIALEASGFYFNEVTGKLSPAPLTLRGWYQVVQKTGQHANINVITHLGNRRVRKLLEGGATLDEAVRQAESELVKVLGVLVPTANPLGSAQTLINSAYLFAVSAVLAEAGRVRGGNPEFQELLNQLAEDLEDGTVDPSLTAELRAAQDSLDAPAATANLAARLKALGQKGSLPNPNQLLDSDLDGLVNEDDNCPNTANADQADLDDDGVGDVCCGNGELEGHEECDDGKANSDTADCTKACKQARCGDGLVDANSEKCDDGNTVDGDGCQANCGSQCGNGAKNAGEQCDDGNNSNCDGCDNDCTKSDVIISLDPMPTTAGSPMPIHVLIETHLYNNGDPIDVTAQVGAGNPIYLEEVSGYRGTLIIAGIEEGPAEVIVSAFANVFMPKTCQRAFPFTYDGTQITAKLSGSYPWGTVAGSSALTLQLTGQDFVTGAHFFFGDTELSAKVTSSTSAEVTVPAALLTSAGTRNLVLRNSGSKSIASNAIPFVITEALPPAGAWTTTGSALTARQDTSAQTLSDGRVLLIGGRAADGTIVKSTELYDPSDGKWSATGELNNARAGQRAVLLASGEVLTAGGDSDASGTRGASSETFDPSSGSWTATNPLSEGRTSFGMAVLADGTVLASGGLTNVNPWHTNSAEIYDPATRTWTPTGSMAGAHDGHTLALLSNGKVLAVGAEYDLYESRSAELYAPETGQWTKAGFLSERSHPIALALSDGRALVVGGLGSDGKLLANFDIYHPGDTGPWAFADTHPFPHAVDSRGVVLPSQVLLVVGGRDSSGTASKAAELLDLRTGLWRSAGSMHTARVSPILSVLPSGKVLVTGGFGSDGLVTTSTEIFDPTVP